MGNKKPMFVNGLAKMCASEPGDEQQAPSPTKYEHVLQYLSQ